MRWGLRIGSTCFSEGAELAQAFEIVEPGPRSREEVDVTGEEENEGGKMASQSKVNFNSKTPKGSELVARAKARCREENEPFAVALCAVAREDPELARCAREEALRRKITFEQVGDYEVAKIENDATCDLGRVVANMARERAAEKAIGFSQALSEISQENPILIARYRAQVLGID